MRNEHKVLVIVGGLKSNIMFNFMKIRPVVAELFRADGRTDKLQEICLRTSSIRDCVRIPSFRLRVKVTARPCFREIHVLVKKGLKNVASENETV